MFGPWRQRLNAVAAVGLVFLACGVWASAGRAATFAQTQTLTAPDSSTAGQFGTSVATEGNTMVVGAPYDEDGTPRTEGAAFAFTQTSPGTWSEPQTLTGDPAAARSEMFGSAVAISGNTMVVGAPAAGNDTGAAYVFTRSAPGASWTHAQALTGSNSSGGSYFGSAVAIDGNTIVVGAFDEDETAPSGDDYGAAYVYTRPSAGAAFTQSTNPLTAPSGEQQIDDIFGYAVAVSGQTVFVGAPDEQVSTNSDEGSLYAYTEASAGNDWNSGVTETTLRPTPAAQSEQFGISLAVQGSTLVVGAQGLASGATVGVGAAFVYTVPVGGAVTTADEDAELQPPSGGSTEPFWGGSVAIDDATIVLGSGQGGVESGDGPYVYSEPSGGWSSSAAGTQLPVIPGGTGVAVSGTTVVIGQGGVSGGAGDAISFSQTATHLTLSLSPTSIAANGSSTSVATATITDAAGDSATAETVNFAASDPGVKIGTVTNNGDGTYSATITSSGTAGAVTITATDTSATPNVAGQATLTQTSSGGSSGGSTLGGSPSPTPPTSPTSPTPPTSSQLSASLSSLLAPGGSKATIKAILKAGGFTFTYKAREAGKLVIDWYQVPPGAHVPAIKKKKTPKPVLVADATFRFSKAGTATIKLRLTAAGKKLLKDSKRLRLTSTVSFTPAGTNSKTTSRSKTFTLK
jgi:hypothetical protein